MRPAEENRPEDMQKVEERDLLSALPEDEETEANEVTSSSSPEPGVSSKRHRSKKKRNSSGGAASTSLKSDADVIGVPASDLLLSSQSTVVSDGQPLLRAASKKNDGVTFAGSKSTVSDATNPPEQTPEKPVVQSPVQSPCVVQIEIPDRLVQEEEEEPLVVQFTCSIYYCTESEGNLVLDVMRIGDLSKTCEVWYCTADPMKRTCINYVEQRDKQLKFKAGDFSQEIRIPLIVSKYWNTTTEFNVMLYDARGCVLGRYLKECRVKVIHEGVFPSQKFPLKVLKARWALKQEEEDQLMEEINRDEDLRSTRITGIERSKTIVTKARTRKTWALETDKKAEEVEMKKQSDYSETMQDISLLWEYFQWNRLSNEVVRKGTLKKILLSQLHNIRFIMDLFIELFLIRLIDPSKNPDEDDSTVTFQLCVLALMLLLPRAVVHVLDYLEPAWKVAGSSRGSLQKALVTKFLNYSEISRGEVELSDMIMTVDRDVADVVHDGYVNFLKLIHLFGQLAWTLLFQLIAPWYFKVKYRVMAFVVIFYIPPLMFVVLARRFKTTKEHVEMRNEAEVRLCSQVSGIVINYRLIAEYNRRPVFVDKAVKTINVYNKAFIDAAQILVNNAYFSQWFTYSFLAFYFVYGGSQVYSEEMNLGMFLVNCSVIKEIGMAWGEIHRVIIHMQAVTPGFDRIVRLLNLATDVPQRMRLNRKRRDVTKLKQGKLIDNLEALGHAVDRLPILVSNIDFKYGPAGSMGIGSEEHFSLPSNMNVQIDQGQLVGLVGPKGEGKATILKLIGSIALPKPSSGFFVPSHLRVLHVSAEPIFFRGTLYENLTFGVNNGEEDEDPWRVKEICKMLGLQEPLLTEAMKTPDVFEQDVAPVGALTTGVSTLSSSSSAAPVIGARSTLTKGEQLDGQFRDPTLAWMDVPSQSQRCLLGLARALIMNPELMCMHKPTCSLDEETSTVVMDALKAFVQNKGLVQDEHTKHFRRPRTCIITASRTKGLVQLDKVWHVSKEAGVELYDEKKHNLANTVSPG